MFDWTTYSKLTCLQINVETILFSERQFDSFFDKTHIVIWCDTRKCITPSLIDHIALPTPQEEFLPKILKLRDLITFYKSRKFTLFTQHNPTQQH